MNRPTALFLAIAILLAHTLSIHKNLAGEIAPPYDFAHVAYRLARDWVQTGRFGWEGGLSGVESYPSLTWVAISAVAERLYLPVTMFTQTVGMICALLVVLAVAQFSPERLAGIIAPLLIVVSGGLAAAGGSGLETALFALVLTVGFLAFERRLRWTLAGSLSLAAWTRPEGVYFVLAILVFELHRAWRDRRLERADERQTMLPVFAVPGGAVVLLMGLRAALGGHPVPVEWLAVVAPDGQQLRAGLVYLRDFFVGSGGPLLFVFPLSYLLRRKLSPLGDRACALTLFWCVVVACEGGGPLPFSELMVPILPILFVAVQEAMTVSLDRPGAFWPRLTWVLFVLGLVVSALTSKYPGDLGPLPLEGLHRRWMQSSTRPRFGYTEPLGRLGVAEEIEVTERLRAIGIFLRERVDPGHRVWTPWPGAIAYLSRLQVIDALGRCAPAPGAERTRPWNGRPRSDVLGGLAERPEYLVPMIRFSDEAPTLRYLADSWARGLDSSPHHEDRVPAFLAALEAYELITVPIDSRHTRRATMPLDRFFLMRLRSLGLTPLLEIVAADGGFRVLAKHRSHEQLVDLRLRLVERDGRVWTMTPIGRFEPRPDAIARHSLQLFPTGTHSIELVRGELPAEGDFVELRAVLLNPGAVEEEVSARASAEVIFPLER
jgi:hypothetical protein